MRPVFYLQNGANGYFATVTRPTAGATLTGQVYGGSPSQQWIPVEYPGTDPNDTGGVVCVLFYAETLGGSNLVITAYSCGTAVSLQPFKQDNLAQLWAYRGTGVPSTMRNLENGCMLDLDDGKLNGIVQTRSAKGNQNQAWQVVPQATTQTLATEREPAAAAV